MQLWLSLVTQLDGERLLRIKAIARCARSGDVFALHSVIARGMPERALAAALAALRGALDS